MLFREVANIQITEPRSNVKYKGTLKNIYNEVNTQTEFKIGTKKMEMTNVTWFQGCPFCAFYLLQQESVGSLYS